MGFNDRDIVALSGAHTLGRCHAVRSGFDGPWTTHPLRFDNDYFKNLINLTWVKRNWSGKLQYEDKESGKLMMLPTDLALIQDAKFRHFVNKYAEDQGAWFRDFASAFSRLIALGCPEKCQPDYVPNLPSGEEKASAEFREHAMHGSVDAARKVQREANVNAVEATSGRTALHKAAFWGHVDMVKYLLQECKLHPDKQDNYGDTALHDACKFGHAQVVQILKNAGANTAIKNKQGRTPADVARVHQKKDVSNILSGIRSRL